MNSHEAGKRDDIIQSSFSLSCKLSAVGEWEMTESSGVCVSVCVLDKSDMMVVYVCLVCICCMDSFGFVFVQNENGKERRDGVGSACSLCKCVRFSLLCFSA